MQSKLQAIAAALWQIAEKTGKAGKIISTASSRLPATSKVPPDNCALAAKTPIHIPRGQPAALAFGVPDTADIKTYVAPKTWHVWEFTWEHRS